MHRNFLLACSGLVLTTVALAQEATAVSGVVSSPAGEVFPDITVQIDDGRGPAKLVKTDAQGRYHAEGLKPGPVRISASIGKSGTPPRTVTLLPGRTVTLDIPIAPTGEIVGAVLDPDGTPIPGISVGALVNRFAGAQTIRDIWTITRTDSAGRYRLGGIVPGVQYIIGASLFPPAQEDPAQASPAADAWTATFYPATEFAGAALPVEISAAEPSRTADIQLLRRETHCIHGQVSVAGASNEINYTVWRADFVAQHFFILLPLLKARNDGSIKLCGLTPGAYRVSVFSSGPRNSPRPSGLATEFVTVFDRDASLAPAPHLPIAVAADLRWAEPVDAIHQVGIELKPIFRSAQLLGESSNLTADVPGRITLDAYPGEDYAVTITGAPAGAYVKQLKYGTADLTAETFRPGTQMDNSLHIVLGRDGGSLDTQVVDKEGLPIPHSTVVVYDEQLTDLPRLAANVVLGQTDQFGRWQSPALAPGKYRVCALLSDLVKSPEMLAQLLRSRKDSVGVEIGSRSESLMTLQPITLR